MRVEEFLERSAQIYPEKTALVCGEQRWTYHRIEEQANRLAHALIRQGVQHNDRIAVCLDNSPEAVLSIFGILKVGAVLVSLNPTVKAEKLAYMLNNCEATALITDRTKFESTRNSLLQSPHLRSVLLTGDGPLADPGDGPRCVRLDEILKGSDHSGSPPQSKGIDADLAALIYTSGSTGKPKGVMLTHINICSAITTITEYLENTTDDIILNVLPLAYSYGLCQLLGVMKTGSTLVLERSSSNPFAVVERIRREKVTGFALVPTIVTKLLGLGLERYDFSTLRYVTNAAAALSTHKIRKLREALPHVKIFSMYGQTECIRISFLPPDQIDTRPASVGRGMPNQEVFIVDQAGQRLGPGQAGELVVRGPHVMSGYWRLPEETERALRRGPVAGEKFLYTGDLFKMDDEGYLYFVSRKDDIIKTGGAKVSPREVEEVLYALDGVEEAAVVGVPDEILGQAVKAVIRLRRGARLSRRDVIHYCAQRLEEFMVPTVVEFRDTLPQTSSGKISKRELTG